MLLLQPLGIADAIRTIVAAHPYATVAALLILIFAIFNAAVQAMEKPTEKDGRGYRFLFRFSHLLAFNFRYALRAKFPDYVPENDPQA